MAEPDGGGVSIEALDLEECLALVEGSNVGRVGLSIDALPVVLPVNYVLHNGAIVFRSTAGTKLSAALGGAVVAFEVDDYEPSADLGWSVLVQGMATDIDDTDQLTHLRALPLRHISRGGTGDHFISVEMKTVTGRRIRPRYRPD